MSSHWLGAHPPNAGQIPVVTSILKDFSAEALGELRTWLEQNPPAVTIQSIIGFSQFTAQPATTVLTDQTTSSNAFTDLATVGPTLTGLPDGQYLLLWGSVAYVSAGAGASAAMALKINSTEADNNDAIENASAAGISIAGFTTKTLSNAGNNTVTARYRVANAAGTVGFNKRTLIAFKFDNK